MDDSWAPTATSRGHWLDGMVDGYEIYLTSQNTSHVDIEAKIQISWLQTQSERIDSATLYCTLHAGHGH